MKNWIKTVTWEIKTYLIGLSLKFAVLHHIASVTSARNVIALFKIILFEYTSHESEYIG